MKKKEEKSLEKSPKRQVITIGAILEIPISNEYFVYAQILEHGLYAFFDFRSVTPIRDYMVLQNTSILFIIGVYNYVVNKCIWRKVGKLPIRKELVNVPMMYIYDFTTDKFSLYDCETGTIIPATKEQARGLEQCAVWAENHVEDRIRDYYNHVPCIWLEEHYALFPESLPK
jgi:hypothetical protein